MERCRRILQTNVKNSVQCFLARRLGLVQTSYDHCILKNKNAIFISQMDTPTSKEQLQQYRYDPMHKRNNTQSANQVMASTPSMKKLVSFSSWCINVKTNELKLGPGGTVPLLYPLVCYIFMFPILVSAVFFDSMGFKLIWLSESSYGNYPSLNTDHSLIAWTLLFCSFHITRWVVVSVPSIDPQLL